MGAFSPLVPIFVLAVSWVCGPTTPHLRPGRTNERTNSREEIKALSLRSRVYSSDLPPSPYKHAFKRTCDQGRLVAASPTFQLWHLAPTPRYRRAAFRISWSLSRISFRKSERREKQGREKAAELRGERERNVLSLALPCCRCEANIFPFPILFRGDMKHACCCCCC